MNVKRLICLTISFAIAFSAAIFSAASAAENKDITGAYGLMNALGVFNGETNPNAPVTRRQMAVYIQRITGAVGETNRFYDVAADDEDAAVIGAVAQNGYMTGNGGYFYPERNLTLNEAATALLRVAGYEAAAVRSGGYATGYLKWAVNSELLKNVDNTDGEFTHGKLTLMLYNLMSVKMFVVENYKGNGDNTQAISKTDTVLGYFFDCIKWRGRVVATHDVSIWNRTVCEKGQVIINNGEKDYLYISNSSEFDGKLGIQADFYTKNGEEEIVYCEYNYSQYDTEKFFGDDILATDRALSFIEYTSEKNKRQKVNTSEAAFVYNGRNSSELTAEDLRGDYSVIECCDVDSDGKADILYVWSYQVIMVDSVNLSDCKITDKINGQIVDFNPDECETTVRLSGRDFDLADIKENYTLLVAQADGDSHERKLTIDVYTDSVEGTLTGKSDDKSIVIDAESYKVRNSLDISALKLNEEYIVGIDFEGNALCIIDKNSWPQKYGFAMKVANNATLKENIQIRLFTENNCMEILTFAKKFKLNGIAADYKALTESSLFEGNIFKEQLVSYKTNLDGMITHLNISDTNEVVPSLGGQDSLTLNKRVLQTDTSVYYRLYSGAGQFGDYMSVDGITKNFYILKSGDEFAEDDFFTGTATQIGLDKGYYNVDIYDATYERIAGAAVYYITENQLTDAESDIYGFIVSKVRHTKDEDGTDIIELAGLCQGKESTLRETELIKFSTVRPGDVLMTWNADKKLSAYRIMFSLDEASVNSDYIGYDSASDEFDPENRTNPLASRVTGYYAEILSKSSEDDNVYLTKTRSGKVRPIITASFTNFYVYDVQNREIKFVDKNGLENDCKNVFFVNTYGVPRDVIIYK